MASKVKAVDIDKLEAPVGTKDTGGKLKPGNNTESFKLASFWKGQVDQVDKANSRWLTRGNTVLRRYRDERNKLSEEGQRKMNLLWANIKVMKPAIYSKCPDPVVDRKFLDKDPVGRLSSMILERGLRNELQNGFHETATAAVYDRLLPGRGVAWVRYEPDIGEGASIPSMNPTGIEDQLSKIGEEEGDKRLTEETDEEEQLEESGSTVIQEKVVFDYVDWKDYYVFPAKARTKAEIQAEGKKVYISRKEAIERFGEEIGKAMQPDTTILADTSQKSTGYSDTAIFRDINERNMVVFEVWNRSDRRVYWFSPGYEYLCDVQDDPLELTGFFPARYLSATTTNDTLIPVPDYWEWQDQAIQIDELTSRIAALTKACKIAGVYNAASPEINRIFNESVENKLIPVDQWAMFADKGGLKGVIDFIPIKEIQECIRTLGEVRSQCMTDLDQVTGLSDIIRGTSDSRETLGGIRLKNNNAGTRLSESQEDVANFCRDLIRVAAEVMCKHFSDETLIESSGILYEEELQPDIIMREFFAANPASDPSAQQTPQQGQPQAGQPLPNPQRALPAPQPSQQQGSNIVPFPHAPPQMGAGGAAGQSGGGQGQQAPTPLMPQPTPPPPDPQTLIMLKVKKALELLRKDVARGYRIDIETDSTIFGDKVQDRQDATEFIGAIGQYMNSMQEIGTTMPEAAPLLAKMLQWGVRKYRTGRDLESEVDNFAVVMQKKAKDAAANPQPNPEMQKAQMEIQKEQMKIKAQADNDQRDAARQQQEDQRQVQMDQMTSQREQQKMQQEMQLEQERMAMERQKMQMEFEIAKAKHQMEMQKLQVGAHVKMQEAHVKQQGMQQEQAMAQQEHGMHMQESQQQHQHTMQQGQHEVKMAEKEHALEKQSLEHKAKAEKQSHGLKMEQHKMKAKEVKKKGVK